MAIQRFQVIRNTTRFESHTGSDSTNLGSLALLYAENGRGKTSLSAILRSLRSGDPNPILARQRLGVESPPHVVIRMDDGPPVVFENGSWATSDPRLAVFDDAFVDENVFSGLSVGSSHRQGLHEVVVGQAGVELAREIERLNDQIEIIQQDIRRIEGQFDRAVLGNMTITDFCALPVVPDLSVALEEVRRRVAGLENADGVRRTPSFAPFTPPSIPIEEIEAILAATLDDIDATALAGVREHLASLGPNGEAWVATGMQHADHTGPDCPFCRQDLGSSDVFAHYRGYFGDAYERHRSAIANIMDTMTERLSGDRLAEHQRLLGEQRELHRFWSDYVDLAPFGVDHRAIAEAWVAARDQLQQVLAAKVADPLRAITLPPNCREAVQHYEDASQEVRSLSQALQGGNPAVDQAKLDISGGDVATARQDLTRLERTQARHGEAGSQLAQDWAAAKARKDELVQRKSELRDRLDAHRDRVFPAYEQDINELLRRFNAGFRLAQLAATNPRGQPSTEYYVEINQVRVPLGGDVSAASPHFGSALSAGDRTTLAFAFFLASLRADPDVGDRIVVIDDPVSSLDDYRTTTTAVEIRSLAETVPQLILLSHSKRLLCTVWQHAPADTCSAHEIRRHGEGSDIVPWNVHQEAATEYDQRHELIRRYVRNGGSREDANQVAAALRPALEGYLRVACVEHFPPGTLLGPFVEQARRALERGSPVISMHRVAELEHLKDFANRFHHNTNPAWDRALADLNEQELEGYARRVLDFVGT
jgi:wobble nucleotide-excising tRNase